MPNTFQKYNVIKISYFFCLSSLSSMFQEEQKSWSVVNFHALCIMWLINKNLNLFSLGHFPFFFNSANKIQFTISKFQRHYFGVKSNLSVLLDTNNNAQ